MKKALFISRNLIGDGIHISRAFSQWYREYGSQYDQIDMLTLEDYVKPIYSRMGVPCRVITRDEDKLPEYDFTFDFDIPTAFKICDQKRIHVAEAYAEMLHVELPFLPAFGNLKPIFIPTEETIEPEYKGNILISMFSQSCASRQGNPPTTMIPFPKWRRMLDVLATEFPGTPIRFLGGPHDRATGLEISEEQYMTAIPLNRLALIMKDAKLVVTVGNGMSHLAAAMEAPTFLFYQRVLALYYILPKGNPKLRFAHVDPGTINPAGLAIGLRIAIKDMRDSGYF